MIGLLYDLLDSRLQVLYLTLCVVFDKSLFLIQ